MISEAFVSSGILYLRAAGLRWAPPLREDSEIAATVRVFRDALEDSVSQDEFRAAVKIWCRTGRDWPTPADLREIAVKARTSAAARLPAPRSTADDASAAKAMAKTLAEKHGAKP